MAEADEVRIETVDRRIRALARGHTVVDTTRPLMVWEAPNYPTYYLRLADVDTDRLLDTGTTRPKAGLGEATVFDLDAGGEIRPRAAYTFPEPEVAALRGHIAFRWASLDHWFEEDEEVFVHARDPYTRIDILRSSRPVRIEIDGEEVASSTNASFLYESGLPVRFYLPKTDVRFELLTESERHTACPYKGTARYWHVSVDGTRHDDIVWGYDHPLPESQKIAGLVSFYNEKVDIYLDGELQERPRTVFG